MPPPARAEGTPPPWRGWAASWILFRALRRCGGNPATIVRWLDRRRRMDAAAAGLSTLASRCAPWTWGHRCLYHALLRYGAGTGQRVLHLGLTYRFAEAKFGHCWITVNGELTDERDRPHARYFSRPFARRGRVAWWLPSGEFGEPAPATAGSGPRLRVTLVALNVRGYWSPAPLLLREYALRDDAVRAGCSFRIIDPAIVGSAERRGYGITPVERLADLWRMIRRDPARGAVAWFKTQIRCSPAAMRAVGGCRWWWTLARVLVTRPGLAGFSCYIWNVAPAVRMARWLKRLSPRTLIVFGGQEVTNSGAAFLRDHPWMDAVVDGEGEESFRALLAAVLQRGPAGLCGIPGVHARAGGPFAPRPLLDPLVGLPPLAPVLRTDSVTLGTIARSRLGYMVETARGCPFTCSFCFESDKFTRVRHLPLTRVEDEIAGMSLAGIRAFHILDPVLCNSSADRLKALAAMLRRASPTGTVRCSVEVYAELLREDMLDSLDVFSAFDVGLQTCNPHVLARIHRHHDREKFLRGIGWLRDRGAYYAIYLIYGLPGETLWSFMKSLRFVLALRPPEVFINHLCVLRGTPLRDGPEAAGLAWNPAPPYLVRATTAMPADRLDACKNLCNSVTREFKAPMANPVHA